MNQQTLIQELFALEGHRAKVDWLARLQPLEIALQVVLEAAAGEAATHPEASRESLLAMAHVADSSGMALHGAQARYLAAQNFAANGQLNIALNLIEAARAAFAKLGNQSEVLRTHIGRINVLAELGRYPEALEMANEVVNAVAAMVHPEAEYEQLRCLAWLNMGSCYWHMGSHASALASFAAAEAGFRRIGAFHRLPAVANNRGLVLMEMGRIREAMEAFLLTAQAAEAAQTRVPQGQALANAARANTLMGEFGHALARFAESRRILKGLAATDEAIILRETADLYLSLNLYDEARAAYEESIGHLRESGALRHLGWSLWGLGAYAIATGNHELAGQSLAEAAEVFTETDNSMSLSGVLLERSSLHLLAGNREAAHADAAHALALVSRSDLLAAKAFAHLRIAEAFWEDPELAGPHVLEAQQLSTAVGLPHLLFRCQLRAGQLRRLQNRPSEARKCFEDAIAQVERLRGRIPQEAVRASFMGDKAEAYEEWVTLLIDMGELDAAFTAAEHAKSRSLVDVLNSASAMGRMAPAANARGKDLHGELMAVYNRLLSSDPAVHTGGMLEELRKRARSLEAELQGLSLKVPDVSDLMAGTPFGAASPGPSVPLFWSAISETIPHAVSVVEYFCTRSEVIAFVAGRDGIHVQRQLCKLDTVRALSDRLFVQMQRCELQGAVAGFHQAGLIASCRRVLQELHSLLIEPIQQFLQPLPDGDPVELVVVPHGPLHRLPFHAFCDSRGKYLIEDYKISYAPSATVWALCQQQPRTSINRATLIGSTSEALPSIAEELEALHSLFPSANVLRDGEATIDAVRKGSSGQDLVHLACHGTFRTDNPLFSALQLADGWITAADLLSLDLNGALLTLSACESGRSHVTGGDELIGFSRAALAAGASSVVVSGWRVDDVTTARLMERFYTALLAGESRATALRSAQLELLSGHPHPWHWAAFSLSGQR
jgi:tetratricopeptide (TPR) repeat protein